MPEISLVILCGFILCLFKVESFSVSSSSSQRISTFPRFTSRLFSDNDNKCIEKKPSLVVGATGRVGRQVVEKLLQANKPVRALVRNYDKATELFENHVKSNPNFQIVICDLGESGKNQDWSILNEAVEGCECIISVSGCLRFSKISDFLPWRLFRSDVSGWADVSHPYYANYIAQCALVDLAKKHSISRFVRLTGLSSGFSPFNPVSTIFSTILSLTSRYHFLCEQYLRNSMVPYVILRPGGLGIEDRDPSLTHLQVDASGSLPPPGRVPRSDVAALAVVACSGGELFPDQSYTLAIRAVGDMKPKPQGRKEDGFASAEECLKAIKEQPDTIDKTRKSKSYGLAVGILVYSLLVIGFKLTSALGMGLANFLLKTKL